MILYPLLKSVLAELNTVKHLRLGADTVCNIFCTKSHSRVIIIIIIILY